MHRFIQSQYIEMCLTVTDCTGHHCIVQDISLVLKLIIEVHRDRRSMTSIVRLEAVQMAVSLTELYGLQ